MRDVSEIVKKFMQLEHFERFSGVKMECNIAGIEELGILIERSVGVGNILSEQR